MSALLRKEKFWLTLCERHAREILIQLFRDAHGANEGAPRGVEAFSGWFETLEKADKFRWTDLTARGRVLGAIAQLAHDAAHPQYATDCNYCGGQPILQLSMGWEPITLLPGAYVGLCPEHALNALWSLARELVPEGTMPTIREVHVTLEQEVYAGNMVVLPEDRERLLNAIDAGP